jgi:hypothetical protein
LKNALSTLFSAALIPIWKQGNGGADGMSADWVRFPNKTCLATVKIKKILCS